MVGDAGRAGIHRWHLKGASWRRTGRGTYTWSGLTPGPLEKLAAAQLRLPREAAFSGMTAAWLHGLDVDPCDPVEVTIPKQLGVSGRAGLAVRQSSLEDVVKVRGMRATSVLRTVAEVCCRLNLIEAVVVADMALHAGVVSKEQLISWARGHAGRRGVKNLRRVIDFAESAAESPMESRLRMVLVLGGLPKPRAQHEIHDRLGQFAGRVDLYYEESRLGIEYDGATHRNTLAQDNRRQNRLIDAGITLLRFTSSDVLDRPDITTALVRARLRHP